MIKRIINKIRRTLNPPPMKFDSTGERVDITYNENMDFETMDVYQKSHFRRYQFAVEYIKSKDVCGDFACGTGYGSVMLSRKAQKVIGADLNGEVIKAIKKRYKSFSNIEFLKLDLLNLDYNAVFDNIVSFETIEHFYEDKISQLLANYNKALKQKGNLIFSTPYMQEQDEAAMKLGHHHTFYINEEKLKSWLSDAGFNVVLYKFQNYKTHTIHDTLAEKDFVICVATKR